jgi:hydroxyethylthiazole kinase-like uncharacterized protein yjeF
MAEPAIVTAATLREWPLPEPGDDKEQRGRLVVVGGTATTPGAVILAAEAGLRAGAGKLVVATAESVAAQVAAQLPEAAVHGLAEDRAGNIDPAAAPTDLVGDADTVLVGPGFIDPKAAAALVAGLVRSLRATVVVDALASAFVTEGPERLAELAARFVLTMNPLELGKTLRREEGQSPDPAADAAELARRTGAVVLCGGTDKLVADPSGERWCIKVGGPGLGVSGSGDVQAGLVTGLVARGASPAQAAVWGGYLHGRAGDRLAETVGAVGFLAREIPAEVPGILTELATP